ncbi:MAG: NUDIX domain-containing protein [Chloroflexi bacterium]|nr:NUDIX domain-containing protein [Chloroflexota bacterium]
MNEPRRSVVTAFLEHNGRILVLRRGRRVGTYQGRWAGVSGFLEPGNTPEHQARVEIQEETGLTDEDIHLIAAGAPLMVDDPATGRRWLVYPFRFAVLHPERIRLDWEHEEMRWIAPSELEHLETVPRLAEAWEHVAPSRQHGAGEEA